MAGQVLHVTHLQGHHTRSPGCKLTSTFYGKQHNECAILGQRVLSCQDAGAASPLICLQHFPVHLSTSALPSKMCRSNFPDGLSKDFIFYPAQEAARHQDGNPM